MKKYILLISVIFLLFANISRVNSQNSNVSLIGEWLNGNTYGWNCDAIYLSGNYAYLGTGYILTILDVSNLSAIIGKGQILLPKKIKWISVQNNYAYVAVVDSGLRIIDVSNPIKPIEKGFIYTVGTASAITVSGNYVYIANLTNGLRIIDISNPASPIEVSSVNLGSSYSLHNVSITGNYAYLAYGNKGLRIYNISNPSSPLFVDSLSWSTNISNVNIQGNFAYVVDNITFRILNISNPINPVLVGSGSINSYGNLNNTLFVTASRAYIGINLSLGTFKYEIWDISNPISPIKLASPIIPCDGSNLEINEIFVNGNDAYFVNSCCRELYIYDVTNPNNVIVKAKYLNGLNFGDVLREGQYLYAVQYDFPLGGFLGVFDISTISSPQFLSIVPVSKMRIDSKISISGNYIYLTQTDTTIRIFDKSNAFNITKAGYYYENGLYASGIQIKNNYLYACCFNKGLRILDLSNPVLPVLTGSLILSGGFEALQISVSGNFAYVTDKVNKLHVINVSNPSSPVEVGSIQMSAAPGTVFKGIGDEITVIGNYAYVANPYIGFQVFDISNPSNPIARGEYTSVGEAFDATISGNLAFISDFINGLQVIDITNPDSLFQVGYYYDVFPYSTSIYSDDLDVYLSNYGGLYIFNSTYFGINEINSDLNNISIFPNPTHDLISFKTVGENLSVIISDLAGKILFKENINNSKSINIGMLAKGVYIVKVINEKEIFSKMIIKK